MSNQLAQVEKRVKSAWYRDGIGELAAGLVLILLGAYFGMSEYFGADSLIGSLLEPSLVLVLIGLLAFGRWVVEALKTRLVYSRSGYVEYNVSEPQAPRWVLAALAAGVLAAALVVSAARLPTLQAIPALTGILGAGVLLIGQFKFSGARRLLLLAALSLATGLLLAASTLAEGYVIGGYYALMGLALLVSGGLVLSHYLRHNPLEN
ncbi:MAG: hypothetical protein KF821_06980 [Anaerolineales bacterium]|nr:hypothetical protein [Anaerolineales bacterium]